MVFRKARLVVFVHGCYWHRHWNCRLASHPKTQLSHWLGVFNSAVGRDVDARTKLKVSGWKVVVVWECEIIADETACLDRVIEALKDRKWPE